jgi:uncharacterized BrkB/YihY/UPF0761 family membrane protein
MKKIEKFLIWFVPLFCLEYIIQGTSSALVMKFISSPERDIGILFSDKWFYFYTAIKPFLSFATKILVSTWLYLEAKPHTTKPFHWAFFGAVVGVLAIAIFYLVQIYDEQKMQRNDEI